MDKRELLLSVNHENLLELYPLNAYGEKVDEQVSESKFFMNAYWEKKMVWVNRFVALSAFVLLAMMIFGGF